MFSAEVLDNVASSVALHVQVTGLCSGCNRLGMFARTGARLNFLRMQSDTLQTSKKASIDCIRQHCGVWVLEQLQPAAVAQQGMLAKLSLCICAVTLK